MIASKICHWRYNNCSQFRYNDISVIRLVNSHHYNINNTLESPVYVRELDNNLVMNGKFKGLSCIRFDMHARPCTANVYVIRKFGQKPDFEWYYPIETRARAGTLSCGGWAMSEWVNKCPIERRQCCCQISRYYLIYTSEYFTKYIIAFNLITPFTWRNDRMPAHTQDAIEMRIIVFLLYSSLFINTMLYMIYIMLAYGQCRSPLHIFIYETHEKWPPSFLR